MKILLSLLPLLFISSISSMELLLDSLPSEMKHELNQFITDGNLDSLEAFWINKIHNKTASAHVMLGRPDQHTVMYSFSPQFQDFSLNHELKKANAYQIVGLLNIKEQLAARNCVNPATFALLSMDEKHGAHLDTIKNHVKKYVRNPVVAAPLVVTSSSENKKQFITIM